MIIMTLGGLGTANLAACRAGKGASNRTTAAAQISLLAVFVCIEDHSAGCFFFFFLAGFLVAGEASRWTAGSRPKK